MHLSCYHIERQNETRRMWLVARVKADDEEDHKAMLDEFYSLIISHGLDDILRKIFTVYSEMNDEFDGKLFT